MNNEQPIIENDEISLWDIIDFFRNNAGLIAAVTVAVFLLAVAYVQFAPKKYEASSVVQMAKFKGLDIETPSALGERLRHAASYSSTALTECGIANPDAVGDYLGGMIKTSTLKTLPDTLDLRVRTATPARAKQCLESVVGLIGKQQYDMVEEQLQGGNLQLAGYRQSLADEMHQLERVRKTDVANIAYLARLDQLSALRSRIDELESRNALAHASPTKLAVPISTSGSPVSPRVKLSLLIGLLLGIALGIALALAKTAWHTLNR
ncbi:Wzz/FepE/Etk N-terminal domain-containing protein [Ferrigenium sp. UT5]|uniref:Wzz/FepE/Etk N-terminal domain-containing protein n=1 Tax=Ferrigenium sp. UT5 TaxID=3242105 RepID=UPI00354F9F9E